MNMSARRIGAVILGAATAALLSAFAASAPAAADNGPHIAISGSYLLGSGPDKCAGCHRIHSAQGEEFVLAGAATGEAFCETCHDGVGATTNTKLGLSTAATGNTNRALRGGGFDAALMDSSNSIQSSKYYSGTSIRLNKFANPANLNPFAPNAEGQSVWKASIPALAVGTPTTSVHSMGTQTMWGSGMSTKGDSVDLECTSCHNPHGNGNYRILQTMGTAYAPGTSTNKAAANADLTANVTAITPTVDTHNSGKYVYTLTIDATHKFVPGQQVTVRTSGTSPTTYVSSGIIIAVKNDAAPYTIAIASQTLGSGLVADQSNDVTAIVRPAFPTTIVKATAVGTTYTLTTASAHGLYDGQVVTISVPSGVTSSFTGENLTIDVTTDTAFTVTGATADPAAVGLEGKLYIVGIPDAKPVSDSLSEANGVGVGVAGYKKVYTTNNYFQADDHYYSGAYQSTDSWSTGAGTAKTYSGLAGGYVVNVSQWCATCHTRYLAGSGQSRKHENVVNGVADPMYRYRHNTAYASEGSYNCVQCHVSHGSNAAMTGYAADVTNPDGTAVTSKLHVGTASETFETSRLLRVSNRAICLLCHGLAD